MAANEKLFGTPAEHVLKQTDFKSHRGGQYESWEYDEFDAAGQLVARCSKWTKSDFYGKTESEGWSKRDLDGNIIASGDALI